MELHTYIKCSKCGFGVRASRHTPEECEGFKKFGKYQDKKAIKIDKGKFMSVLDFLKIDEMGERHNIVNKDDIAIKKLSKYLNA